MVNFNPITGNPAAESAILLRRLAFFLLFLILPIAAIVARRALVIIVPVSIALLVLAALLDRNYNPVGKSLKRLFLSPGVLLGILVTGWCVLSLIWSPFPEETSDRLLTILSTIIVISAGYLALPDRMRASNLYLLPIGVAVAIVLALAIELTILDKDVFLDIDSIFQRGLFVLVMLFWPALAWLRSRNRDWPAAGLLLILLAALILSPYKTPLWAFLVGAAGYLTVKFTDGRGARAIAWITAGLVAFAPVLPFLLKPLAVLLSAPDFVRAMDVCQRIVLDDLIRLITGRGFETLIHARMVGKLDLYAPASTLFQIWYELGLVGALGTAAIILLVVSKAGKLHAPLAPGMVAGFLSAYAFACMGIGIAQSWSTTAFASTVLIFIATSRGQFRTERPRIFIVRS